MVNSIPAAGHGSQSSRFPVSWSRPRAQTAKNCFCPLCNKRFSRYDVMLRHIEHMHDNTPTPVQVGKGVKKRSCLRCYKGKLKCTGGETCLECFNRDLVCHKRPDINEGGKKDSFADIAAIQEHPAPPRQEDSAPQMASSPSMNNIQHNEFGFTEDHYATGPVAEAPQVSIDREQPTRVLSTLRSILPRSGNYFPGAGLVTRGDELTYPQQISSSGQFVEVYPSEGSSSASGQQFDHPPVDAGQWMASSQFQVQWAADSVGTFEPGHATAQRWDPENEDAAADSWIDTYLSRSAQDNFDWEFAVNDPALYLSAGLNLNLPFDSENFHHERPTTQSQFMSDQFPSDSHRDATMEIPTNEMVDMSPFDRAFFSGSASTLPSERFMDRQQDQAISNPATIPFQYLDPLTGSQGMEWYDDAQISSISSGVERFAPFATMDTYQSRQNNYLEDPMQDVMAFGFNQQYYE